MTSTDEYSTSRRPVAGAFSFDCGGNKGTGTPVTAFLLAKPLLYRNDCSLVGGSRAGACPRRPPEIREGRLLLLVAEGFGPVLDHPDNRWGCVFKRFGDDKTLAVGGDVVRGISSIHAPVFTPKSRGLE